MAADDIVFEKYFELLLVTLGKDSYYFEAPSTWVARQIRLCLNIQPFQPQQAMTLNSKTARGDAEYTFTEWWVRVALHICGSIQVYKYKYTCISIQVQVYKYNYTSTSIQV